MISIGKKNILGQNGSLSNNLMFKMKKVQQKEHRKTDALFAGHIRGFHSMMISVKTTLPLRTFTTATEGLANASFSISFAFSSDAK